MFLKKLKPIHGWRVFFGEVAIIVLGVGIALVAQQLVQDWNWRSDARQAERQLAKENRDNFPYAAESVAVQPCLEVQLGKLLLRATAAGEHLVAAPPIISSTGVVVYRRPSRPYRTEVWNSVASEGVASHLDQARHDAYGIAYTQIENLRALSDNGDAAVASLNVFMVPLSLDSEVRLHLIEMIMGQKSNSRLMSLVAAQVMDNLWALNQAPTPAVTDAFVANSGTVKYCRSQHLPLASWRQVLIATRAMSVAGGDTTLDKQRYSGRPK